MGAIVGVKAKTPGGEWVELYKGRALISELTLTLTLTLTLALALALNPSPDPDPNLSPILTLILTRPSSASGMSTSPRAATGSGHLPSVARTSWRPTFASRWTLTLTLTLTPTPTPTLILSLSA